MFSEQSVVYKFECGWCDASYVGYMRRHLYQRIDELERSGSIFNRSFAAKPSHDLLFLKLWAATLRMPEMQKACRKHQNGQV